MTKFIVQNKIKQIKKYIEKEVDRKKETKYTHCLFDSIDEMFFCILCLVLVVSIYLFLFIDLFMSIIIFLISCMLIFASYFILAYRNYSFLKSEIKELIEILSFSDIQLLEYINSHKEDMHKALYLCMYFEEHPEKVLKINWIGNSYINIKYEHNSIVKDIELHVLEKQIRTDISDTIFEWTPEGLKCKLKYKEEMNV